MSQVYAPNLGKQQRRVLCQLEEGPWTLIDRGPNRVTGQFVWTIATRPAERARVIEGLFQRELIQYVYDRGHDRKRIDLSRKGFAWLAAYHRRKSQFWEALVIELTEQRDIWKRRALEAEARP